MLTRYQIKIKDILDWGAIQELWKNGKQTFGIIKMNLRKEVVNQKKD